MENQNKEYFTRFPNEYIQCDIKSKFGISRKFYITYILIDKYRSYEDYSWITIQKVFDFYGYKMTSRKPKAFKEIVDVLKYMIGNQMIETEQDLNSLSYDTGIEIKIIPENFDATKNFSSITSSQYNAIMMANSKSRENILIVFLYINSHIGCRSKQYSKIEYDNTKEYPEAFFRSINNMAKELSMSKDTINRCLDYLTDSLNNKYSLLIKKEVGNIKSNKQKTPQNIPNIYVLNREGYEQEIKLAMDLILKIYKAEKFCSS